MLGKASMQVSQLLKLGRGAVVELIARLQAIDIYVNNRLVARRSRRRRRPSGRYHDGNH